MPGLVRRAKKLVASNSAAAASRSASFLARLFVMAVLFQLAQNAAELHFLVKTLECCVDGLTRLDNNLNQKLRLPPEGRLYPKVEGRFHSPA